MTPVQRVGVIGAGTMGAGIAAHAASAGLDVVLLDIVPDGARQAVERLRKARPPAFMQASDARRIATGTVDDAGLLAACGWVIEAVIEDAAVKNEVYAQVRAAAPDAVLTSNTSTIPLAELHCDGITHFFNPPRYLPLLEVVGDENQLADVIACADERLGKTVVLCKDAPGFIANRLGAMWIDAAIAEAIARGLDVELADAAIARAFGSPKTGVFGLLDLVGIDLSLDVTRSLNDRLAAADPLQAVDRPWDADGGAGRQRPHRAQGLRRLLPARARPLQARARPRHRRVPARPPLPRRRAGRRRVRRCRPGADAGIRRAHPGRGLRRSRRGRPGNGGGLRLARGAVHHARPPSRAAPPARCAASLRPEAGPATRPRQRLGVGVGHRRGRPLPRVPHEDERHRRRDRAPAGRDHRDGAARAGAAQRGAQFSVGANLAGVLLLANTASWDDLDGAIRAGQEPSRHCGPHRCPWSARRRAWPSAAAARCCCTATRSRRTPSRTWACSSWASASCRPGAAA